MKDTPAKDLDKFVLRMPDGLRDRIKTVAEINNRSMNAEIIATLEDVYPTPQTLTEMVEEVRELAEMYEKAGYKDASILRQIHDIVRQVRFGVEMAEINRQND